MLTLYIGGDNLGTVATELRRYIVGLLWRHVRVKSKELEY